MKGVSDQINQSLASMAPLEDMPAAAAAALENSLRNASANAKTALDSVSKQVNGSIAAMAASDDDILAAAAEGKLANPLYSMIGDRLSTTSSPATPETTTTTTKDQDALLSLRWRNSKAQKTAEQQSQAELPEAAPAAVEELPEVSVENLARVLRTLLVWTSWIHEDVGHAWATFVYNPIHTPGFVPLDGKGICTPALIYRVAAFRNFVAVERNKLSDPIDDMLFTKTHCSQEEGPFSWQSCSNAVNGVVMAAFETFRNNLRNLQRSRAEFGECGEFGFYSCSDRVESSASS
ncbi:unnamed protein product [Effrenium voratum]|nr:unnamed protein product [Effrenium voratum]